MFFGSLTLWVRVKRGAAFNATFKQMICSISYLQRISYFKLGNRFFFYIYKTNWNRATECENVIKNFAKKTINKRGGHLADILFFILIFMFILR